MIRLLEGATTLVLLAVMAALGWMVLVTVTPGGGRLASVEAEVIVMVVLLAAALVLVSVVALVKTR